MVNILYIHGFNSSPKSMKAELCHDYLLKHLPCRFYCPQVASSPKAAIQQLELIVSQHLDEQWVFIGSSLGGYLSTYLSEKYNAPAVLINPAIKPYELLTDYLGEQVNPYTNEVYLVDESFIGDLKGIEQIKINADNYFVMVQTEDEVLNYKQAEQKFKASKLIVEQGGDHSFIDFHLQLPEITRFIVDKSKVDSVVSEA